MAHLPSPCTNKWSVYFINNRYKLWFHSYMYQYSARSFIRKSISSIIRKIWHIHWELGKLSLLMAFIFTCNYQASLNKLILRVSFQQLPFFEISRDYRWCRLCSVGILFSMSHCGHTNLDGIKYSACSKVLAK